ncbi:unnamed protein product, partial [Prorocentrum cordatum]
DPLFDDAQGSLPPDSLEPDPHAHGLREDLKDSAFDSSSEPEPPGGAEEDADPAGSAAAQEEIARDTAGDDEQ